MGTPMTLPVLLADSRALPVTPLVAFLAGPHAETIARIWPAPHEDFLMLPSARRHAAAILALRDGYTAQRVQWLAGRARDGELAAELFGDHPPGGVMKALGRMGEALWTEAAYAQFFGLFRDEAARQLIRHMADIQPAVLSVVATLPPLLRRPSIVAALGADMEAARCLVAAWNMALHIRGEVAGADIARQFGRAKDARALFEMALSAIQPPAFGEVNAPPALPAPFSPVRRTEHLQAVALEMRNCLRDYAPVLASGRMALWIWQGAGGPVAVALWRDAGGWRLAEALGQDNAEVPDAVLHEILPALKLAGIRAGEPWHMLRNWLADQAANAEDLPGAASPAASTRQRLYLGYLWD
ncbi:hypothetical protein ACQKH5_11250 [Hyphomonas sp. NPDC076900]|uniref:hypothetical protein n=1 Tax=unclassified Hyphomonas TaxID=2630699 RepID=UPI003D01D421